MTIPAQNHPIDPQPCEQQSWLALPPILATFLYYLLPESLQNIGAVRFAPQAVSYLCLSVWIFCNRPVLPKLGLSPSLIAQGLGWGLPTGLALGTINAMIILRLVPFLGGDIDFLRETPHAQAPLLVMLPWTILLIAFLVELNFRGFILGRLLALCSGRPLPSGLASTIAVGGSALVFSFDPFMTATFRHLHWIALWDGIIWGLLRLSLRNLHVAIVAHAAEVILMYTVLKLVLS